MTTDNNKNSEWLLKLQAKYLEVFKCLADDEIKAPQLGQMAMEGGAFDFLRDEPVIYSEEDGEDASQDKE